MRKAGQYLILLWLALNAGAALAQTEPPYFEADTCSSRISDLLPVDCGYVVLPEDRANPASRTIRLAVVIFRALGENPSPDPLLYLAGGPGGNAVSNARYLIQQGSFAHFLRQRDVIFFDQRGTESSDPFLVCWELFEAYRNTIGQAVSLDEERRQERQAAAACHDRLLQRGVQLQAYTSGDNAADINDLRRALGYEQVNLYGISYGTKLALTTMRDYPHAVRSVILDSAYPPQVDIASQWANNAERAFRVLFAGCAADTLCNQHYPDLEAAFYSAIDRLDEQPVTLALSRYGRGFEVFMDGDRFIRRLFELLYSTQALPRLPGMIHAASQGEYTLLSDLLLDELFYDSEPFIISDGMHYSVQCSEEIAFSTPAIVEAATSQVNPRIRAVINNGMLNYFAICQDWHTRPLNPADNLPVVSDIPTLILAGEYDPATPPAWGRMAAETLSHSFYYKFPGVAHGVRRMDGLCWLEVSAAFINNPTAEPDTSCISDLHQPRFR